jgi:uncharacterized protein (DUF2336 family)
MSDLLPPSLDALMAMARQEGLDMKPVLLRVLTDMFIATGAHSRDEEAQFEEIASTLVRQVDSDTAAIVACKLAEYRHTPASVGEALVARGDDASRIILADAAWLPRRIVTSQALVGERLLAAAVAARPDLDADLMAILLERRDPIFDVTLAANLSVTLPRPVLDEILARGRHDAAIARALLFRPDLSASERCVLFLHADRADRTRIIEEAEQFVAMSGRNRQRRSAPVDLVVTLETAAMVNDAESFASLLGLSLGVSADTVAPLIADRSGEALALAYAALGIDDEAATRLFMFRDPLVGHSTERVFALTNLVRRVSFAAAEKIVHAVLGVSGTERSGQHVPQYDPAPGVPRPSAQRASDPVAAIRQRRAI